MMDTQTTIDGSTFDPILHRSGSVLGIDTPSAAHMAGSKAYRIQIILLIPERLLVPVTFPGNPLQEVA